MKTLLVAVDGSEPSKKGLAMGLELAKALDANIELVTVEPPILLPPNVYAETIDKLLEANRAHAKNILDDAAKTVEAAKIAVSKVQLQGPPAEAIADLAKADRIWGVVVGAKGHNAFARVLLGSVADRLMHLCTKPVLVVR